MTFAPLTVAFCVAGVNVYVIFCVDGWLTVIVYDPFARLPNVKFPELSAVTVALAAPPRVTVVPLPLAAGLIVPEMLCVPPTEPVKFTPVELAPLTVTFALAGVKAYEPFEGVTVYAPLVTPLNVKAPEPFGAVVALLVPPRVTVAPVAAAVGVIAPEMLKVCAASVKLTPVMLAELTVAFSDVGVNV